MLDDLLAEVCFWLELAVESPTSVSACGPILPAADRFEAVQGETETQRTFKTGRTPVHAVLPREAIGQSRLQHELQLMRFSSSSTTCLRANITGFQGFWRKVLDSIRCRFQGVNRRAAKGGLPNLVAAHRFRAFFVNRLFPKVAKPNFQ